MAQGETVALHSPPIRDLFPTEEIRHHRLSAATGPGVSQSLLILLHPVQTHKQHVRKRWHLQEIYYMMRTQG